MLIGPFTQIVTMRGLRPSGHLSDDSLELIANGGIRVENGVIVEMGPFDSLLQHDSNIHEITTPSVAIPGMIDAHTHICFAGSRANDYALRLAGRTYQEIAAQGGGILDSVRKTRAATLDELTSLTVQRAKILLSRGITTCEVKSGYGLTVADELKILKAIKAANSLQPVNLIPTCLAAHTKPWEFKSGAAYLELIIDELFPLLRQEALARRIDIFVDDSAFTIVEARRYLIAAQQAGFALTIHADQFSRGGALLAAELKAVSADHLEQSNRGDFAALKTARVIPIVLPGATLGMGQAFPAAAQMLEADLPLVIASDWNPGSAPMGDLLTQAALLGAAQKLSMAETLAAITSRAAQALELSDRGILETSKRCDLAIFSCDNFKEILYHQGAMKPTLVFVNGEDYRC